MSAYFEKTDTYIARVKSAKKFPHRIFITPAAERRFAHGQTGKEKEERKLFDKNQLIAGLKEIRALFEEADGIWINLQGKDRKESRKPETYRADLCD